MTPPSERTIKYALRRVMPGYGYNEEHDAWSNCVGSIAKAFGYEHPSDEWFRFVWDCDP